MYFSSGNIKYYAQVINFYFYINLIQLNSCNIDHFRLLLTNDSIEVQQTIMNIVKQIVKAAQEDLKIKNSNTANGNIFYTFFLWLIALLYINTFI